MSEAKRKLSLSEKITIWFSSIALVVSLSGIYFQFFYVSRELKVAVKSASLERDSLLVDIELLNNGTESIYIVSIEHHMILYADGKLFMTHMLSPFQIMGGTTFRPDSSYLPMGFLRSQSLNRLLQPGQTFSVSLGTSTNWLSDDAVWFNADSLVVSRHFITVESMLLEGDTRTKVIPTSEISVEIRNGLKHLRFKEIKSVHELFS